MKLSEYKRNEENPFVSQAIDKIQNNIVKKYKTSAKTGEKAILKAVDENGEIMGHTQFIRQIEVDEEQFAKLYLANFSAFFDLKPSALKVFGYILSQLIPNKDYFYITHKGALEHTGYKNKASLYSGLASLVQNGIIARGHNEYHYFINPMVVFNGNRITFAKTYVKKKKGAIKIKDPNQLEMFEETPPAE